MASIRLSVACDLCAVRIFEVKLDDLNKNIAFIILLHGVFWLYYITFEVIWSASPGKLALQLMVVDAQTGERANWRRILARVAVYYCSCK